MMQLKSEGLIGRKLATSSLLQSFVGRNNYSIWKIADKFAKKNDYLNESQNIVKSASRGNPLLLFATYQPQQPTGLQTFSY